MGLRLKRVFSTRVGGGPKMTVLGRMYFMDGPYIRTTRLKIPEYISTNMSSVLTFKSLLL